MKKWKIFIPVAVLIIALGAAAPFGYRYYSDYMAEKNITEEYNSFITNNKTFYDNSFFNDVDISGMTAEEALTALENSFEAKSISIISADGKEKEEFSFDRLSVDYKNTMGEVLNAFQNQTITKTEYLKGSARRDYSYDIAKDVNYSKINVSGLKCTDIDTRKIPQNAYVSVDVKSGELSVVDEVYGNVLKEGALEKRLEAAIKAGEEELTLLENDYVLPEILSNDSALDAEKDYYNTLLNKSITLNVCGITLGLSPDKCLPLYDFEPGDEVNDEALEDYVRTLKANYDTYKSNRLFHTSTDEYVTVEAGDYGWAINVAETMASLKEVLLNDSPSDIVSAVYKIQGQRPCNDEIGNTYVEVNLRDQKIYMYLDGVQIVNDDVTTAMMGDPECITCTGTFSLAYKRKNVTLKGPTWNDFVYYWMPYDLDHAVGLHDATWRTYEEFGGNNRYGNGSHGCVNCRLDSVAVIYDNIEMDTPIIVWE